MDDREGIMDDLTGKVIRDFELVELLGAGGMGTVYRAYQHSLKRHVAVKILPVSLVTNPEFSGTFYP